MQTPEPTFDTLAKDAPRSPSLETLFAAIAYLMSRYAQRPDRELADAICFHLELLARREDCRSEVLNNAARRLWLHWRALGSGCRALSPLFH